MFSNTCFDYLFNYNLQCVEVVLWTFKLNSVKCMEYFIISIFRLKYLYLQNVTFQKIGNNVLKFWCTK